MILILVVAIFAGGFGIFGFAVRKRGASPEREATDAAIRDLYDHYRSGVEALTQAYLIEAASDEEWLDQIKAQCSTSDGTRQDELSQVRRLLPGKIPGASLIASFLSHIALFPLLPALVVGAIIAGSLMLGSSLLLLIALITSGYIISLRIHPLRKCPTCKMKGRHYGSIYGASYRRCRRCDGTARDDRLGTRVFFGGPHKK
jgi:hypothetical protein